MAVPLANQVMKVVVAQGPDQAPADQDRAPRPYVGMLRRRPSQVPY
jgi:hypothetical protein